MIHLRVALAVLILPALLAACSDDDTRQFSATRDRPNEDAARTLPNLSVPPSLSQRPAQSGVLRASDTTEAENAVRNQTQPTARLADGGNVSAGQASLLDASGPSAPANIRTRIDQEAALAQPDQGFADRLIFGDHSAPNGTIIQKTTRGFWSRIF